MIAGGPRPSRRRMTAILFAGNSIQSALPVGAAFAGLFQFGQYQMLGADEVLAGWVIVASVAVLFATLAGLAGAGLALSASLGSTFDLVEAILGVVLLAALLTGIWSRRLVFYKSVIRAATALERPLGRPEGQLSGPLARALERIQAVAPTSLEWLRAAGWGVATWLTDCTCFMFSLLAVGAPVPWQGLLLAYCAGQLAVNLPITPGGLGVVEGTLTIALIAFDPADKPATVAAVLLYRLLSFWIPLPIGAVCYGDLYRLRRRFMRQKELEETANRGPVETTTRPADSVGSQVGWPGSADGLPGTGPREDARKEPGLPLRAGAGAGGTSEPPGPEVPVERARLNNQPASTHSEQRVKDA